LKALATNWRQKARISAKGLVPLRRLAGEGREAELMLAMTKLCCSSLAAYAAPSAFFGRRTELWPYLLKEGFNCRDLPHRWYPPRNDPW
jgi:hypothetical protein